MLQLLRDQNLSKLATHYAKHAQISAQLLLNLVNDILDLSKITQGVMDIKSKPIELEPFLRHVVELFKPMTDNKKLELQLNADLTQLPKYIASDAIRVRQIILNLLSNAVKFTSSGAIVLTL